MSWSTAAGKAVQQLIAQEPYTEIVAVYRVDAQQIDAVTWFQSEAVTESFLNWLDARFER